MINEKILFVTYTDCGIQALKRHGLGIAPSLDHDVFFAQPLREMFSEVIVYDMRKRYAEVGVRKSNEEIVDIICIHQPKYLLWPSMMYEIMESTFKYIRKQGTLVIGWFFDDEVRFDNYSKWWIPFLDYCLTNDKEAVDKYENLGIHAKHMVLGGNPDIFKIVDVSLKYDVTFVGRNFGKREAWINNMAANGIVVQTFGKGWSNDYIATPEMVKVFNASRINLNFSESYGCNTRFQIKNRIFEVCMAGGFLLCEYVPGIEDFYEIDKEITSFKNIDEAIYKIKYFLTHEDERKAIAEAGYKRAQSDYTPTANLMKVFEEIQEVSNCRNHDEITNSREILNMPSNIRHLPSLYHSKWSRGLMMERFPDMRWREELDLALFYDPKNKEALQLKLMSHLPIYMRRILFYFEPIYVKINQLLRYYIASIPMLRKIKKVLIS